MPELATKSAQLFDELKKLHYQSKIDEITLKRLEREAKKLLAVDALNGYQILGALCGFAGRIAEMRENYDKALQLALTPAERATALHNYATSLGDTGYFSEAAELAFQAQNLEPSSYQLSYFVSKCCVAGLFHRAVQYIEATLDKKLFESVISVTQFMNTHGVQDEELQKMIEIAVSVLRERHFFDFRNVSTGFSSDEESTWFQYVISVDCSVEEMVEMDYELATRLAEADLPINVLSNFLVTYQFLEDADETH